MSALGELDLEAELDRIFQLPLADFIAARDDLVKRLRARDEKDTATEVKRLAKPSVSAWTVNRLHQLEPERMSALIQAGDDLRRAQQEGLPLAEHQAAMDARREALTALLARAAEILTGHGHASSSGTLLRVSKTLEAVSVYGSDTPGPPPGRMSADLEPPGIEALTAFGVAATAGKGKRTPIRTRPRLRLVPPPDDEPKRKPTARQIKKAKEDLATARKHLSEERRANRAAADKAERAEAALERHRAAVTAAEQALEKARAGLSGAEVTAKQRQEEAEAAQAELRRAREAVEAAQQELDELDG